MNSLRGGGDPAKGLWNKPRCAVWIRVTASESAPPRDTGHRLADSRPCLWALGTAIV